MSRGGMGVLAAVFVASAITNVYLWRQRADAGEMVTRPPPDASMDSRESVPTPATRAPADGSMPGGESPVAYDPACAQQLQVLEKDLVRVEAEIEEHLSMGDRFERGAPSSANEERIRDILSKAFGDECDPSICEVECRGSICKILVPDVEGAPKDFTDRFQSSPATRAAFERVGVGGSFERDAITGRRVRTSQITAELAGQGLVQGREILISVLEQFHDNPGVAACKAAHPEPGYLGLRLDIDPGALRILVEQSGSLAGMPGGDCVREILDELVAATSVPAGTLSVPNFYFTVAFP